MSWLSNKNSGKVSFLLYNNTSPWREVRGPHFRTSSSFCLGYTQLIHPSRLDRLAEGDFTWEAQISTKSKHSGPWSLRNNPVNNLQAITARRPTAAILPELAHLRPTGVPKARKNTVLESISLCELKVQGYFSTLARLTLTSHFPVLSSGLHPPWCFGYVIRLPMTRGSAEGGRSSNRCS